MNSRIDVDSPTSGLAPCFGIEIGDAPGVGSVTVNVDPAPFALSTSIVPPIASTIDWTM